MPKKAKATDENPKHGKATSALAAVEAIREKFGDNAIMRLGDRRSLNVSVIPTGAVSLDIALGVFGIPRGRIIEIYGPEASGKTTLAQHIVAQAQKLGGTAAYVDAEHALDPLYSKRIGVNIDDLLISQPDTGEQALDIVETLVRSNAVDVIVIDSVAALTPRAEIEGDMGDTHMGLQARLMSQALRKLTAIVAKSKTCVIFINQIRMKIGVFFGNPETTPGGTALKFYSTVRIEIRRSAQIKLEERVIGNRVKVKIVKNKVAAPFRTTEFDILYNQGISLMGDLLDTAVLFGVVHKSGSSYTYGEEKIGLGRTPATKYLHEHPDSAKKIREATLVAVRERDASQE